MLKRKVIIFCILGISSLFSMIYLSPNVHAIDYNTSDEEDDVLRDCPTGEETGDYYDAIDIIKLIVAGQYINLTIAGSFFDWNSSYYGSVKFSQSFEVNASNHLTWSPPYYSINWQNKSGPIEVTLEKGYRVDSTFAYKVWNGTGWEDRITATPFNIIFNISEHSIISYIPDSVEEIPSNMKAVGYMRLFIWECEYSDLTPILTSKTTPSENGISSYNLFILICSIFGVSAVLLKKSKR